VRAKIARGVGEGLALSRQLLLGVATTVVPCDRQGATVSRFFERLARLARERGDEMIIFHPEHIDFAERRVTGYRLADGVPDHFVRAQARLPDAIYENVYVHLVVRGMTKHLRQGARAHGIPYFNPVIHGKWTMHRFVQAHPDCGMLVPETHPVHSGRTVHEMLTRYPAVYVKPVGGYGGLGVMRIRKLGTDYQLDADRFGRQGHLHKLLSTAQMNAFVHRVTRRSAHIVQQQIPLIHLSGARKVDFRVVVQRDGRGEWQVVGVVPKVTAENGVVTNLVAGGSRGSWADIVRAQGADGARLSREPMETAACRLAQMLSRRYPTLGLLGYDVGLDDKNRTWLIEVNPKPARSLLTSEMRNRSARLAVDFTHYLATQRSDR